MKLRIRGDNLRLRLTQSEVRELAAGATVEQSTQFASGALSVAVNAESSAQSVQADFVAGALSVSLPQAQVSAWAESAEVAIEAQHGAVAILIEKDFACLDPRTGVEDEDTFPNPQAAQL